MTVISVTVISVTVIRVTVSSVTVIRVTVSSVTVSTVTVSSVTVSTVTVSSCNTWSAALCAAPSSLLSPETEYAPSSPPTTYPSSQLQGPTR